MATDAQLKSAATPTPKRRWLQYSTRALLVVVTVLGVTLGIIHRRAERQRQAVAAIEAIGGRVHYEARVGWLEQTCPKDWACNVSIVYLEHTQVRDAELSILDGFPELRCLWLRGTHVSDAGVAHLGKLTGLEALGLQYTDLTDAGLIHLQGLTNLRVLYVMDTRVTDAGVSELQEALPNCLIGHSPASL
jgi:hypothetical protein